MLMLELKPAPGELSDLSVDPDPNPDRDSSPEPS